MQPGTTAVVRPGSSADLRDSFIDLLRTEIGARSFQHWFQGRTEISVEAASIQIRVGSQFQLTWMQRKFNREVAIAARSMNSEATVEWLLQPDSVEPSESAAVDVTAPAITPLPQLPATPVVEQRSEPAVPNVTAERPAQHREGRRFAALEEFVVGRCNELAYTAARHACEAPGVSCNPLYLHGPVGTGKTHLAEAVYKGIRRLHPDKHILFMTAESFANQFTHALRSHALPGFRQRFRNVDVLIIDDADFFDGKRGIQEEFLHTVQQLLTHNRQIVLTADSHPRLLSQTSNELISRYLSGLVCRLETPDLEARRKIAQAKSIELHVDVAPEALDLVARRFTNNVREIEGALNSLKTYQRLTNKRVTLQQAKQVLSDLERDCVRVVKLADIEHVVSDLFGVDTNDLRSDSRSRTISQPRMLAMFLARRHTQAAYKEIGEFFGGRNHSTVMSAERKVESWLRTDCDLRIGGKTWRLTDVVERLERQLQAS